MSKTKTRYQISLPIHGLEYLESSMLKTGGVFFRGRFLHHGFVQNWSLRTIRIYLDNGYFCEAVKVNADA